MDSDELAHEVFRKENRIYRKIRPLFPEVLGDPTRAQVAKIVFRDPVRRRALESMIHPYVFKRIREELARMRGEIAVAEVPLLFETGFDKCCDATVVVRAAREKVLARLAAKGFRQPEVESRWRAQWPIREKRKRADYCVDNSDGRKRTEEQVKKIWSEINRRKGAY